MFFYTLYHVIITQKWTYNISKRKDNKEMTPITTLLILPRSVGLMKIQNNFM